MSIPKATLRKSGQMMITAKIDAHISADDIATALVYYHAMYDDPKDLSTVSRTKAYDIVRKFIGFKGADYAYEDIEEADLRVAMVRVEELFPELKRR